MLPKTERQASKLRQTPLTSIIKTVGDFAVTMAATVVLQQVGGMAVRGLGRAASKWAGSFAAGAEKTFISTFAKEATSTGSLSRSIFKGLSKSAPNTLIGKLGGAYISGLENWGKYTKAIKGANEGHFGSANKIFTNLIKTTPGISQSTKFGGFIAEHMVKPIFDMPAFYGAGILTGHHKFQDNFNPLNPISWMKDYTKYAVNNYVPFVVGGIGFHVAINTPAYGLGKFGQLIRSNPASQKFMHTVLKAGNSIFRHVGAGVKASAKAFTNLVRRGGWAKSGQVLKNSFKAELNKYEIGTKRGAGDVSLEMQTLSDEAALHGVKGVNNKIGGIKEQLASEQEKLANAPHKAKEQIEINIKNIQKKLEMHKALVKAIEDNKDAKILTGEALLKNKNVQKAFGIRIQEANAPRVESRSRFINFMESITGRKLDRGVTKAERSILETSGFKPESIDKLRIFGEYTKKDGTIIANYNPVARLNKFLDHFEHLGTFKHYGLPLAKIFLPDVTRRFLAATPIGSSLASVEDKFSTELGGQNFYVGKSLLHNRFVDGDLFETQIYSMQDIKAKMKIHNIKNPEDQFDNVDKFAEQMMKQVYGKKYKIKSIKKYNVGETQGDPTKDYMAVTRQSIGKHKIIGGVEINSWMYSNMAEMYQDADANLEYSQIHGSIFSHLSHFVSGKIQTTKLGSEQIRVLYGKGYYDKQSVDGFYSYVRKLDELGKVDVDSLSEKAAKEYAKNNKLMRKHLVKEFYKVQNLLDKSTLEQSRSLKYLLPHFNKNKLSPDNRDTIIQNVMNQNGISKEEANSYLDRRLNVLQDISNGKADESDLLYLAWKEGKGLFGKNVKLSRKTNALLERVWNLKSKTPINKQQFYTRIKHGGIKGVLHQGGLGPDVTVADELQNSIMGDVIYGLTRSHTNLTESAMGEGDVKTFLNSFFDDSAVQHSDLVKKAVDLVNISHSKRSMHELYKELGIRNARDLWTKKFSSMGGESNTLRDVQGDIETFFDTMYGNGGTDGNPWFVGLDKKVHQGNAFFMRSAGLLASPQGLPDYIMNQTTRMNQDANHFSEVYNKFGEGTLLVGAEGAADSYGNLAMRWGVKRLNRVLQMTGLNVSTKPFNGHAASATDIIGRIFKQRLSYAPLIAGGFEIANAALSAAGVQGGIPGGLAKLYAAGDTQLAKMRDSLGITKAAQYMEGLMPGSVQSSLGRAARFLLPFGTTMHMAEAEVSPWLVGAGLVISSIAGISSDPTKSADELQKEYTGQKLVPVRKGRHWILSSTPYEGSKIEAYVPSWVTRLTSDYRYTSDIEGSPLESMVHKPLPFLGANFGSLFDPYHYSKKLMYRRPSQYSTPLFHDVPIIGPTLSATIGSIIKPSISLSYHDRLQSDGKMIEIAGQGAYTERAGATAVANAPETMTINTGNQGGAVTNHPAPYYNPYGAQGAAFEQLYQGFFKSTGLIGWEAKALIGVPGIQGPAVGNNRMLFGTGSLTKYSFSHSWWGNNMGDLMAMAEPVKRYSPEDAFRHLHPEGPYNSTMPVWLPIRYRYGDAFTELKAGELRLPNSGYIATHDVKRQFPIMAQELGTDPQTMADYAAGIAPHPLDMRNDERSSYIKKIVLNSLSLTNKIIKYRVGVYDPGLDVDGSIDALIQAGDDKLPVLIKRLTQEQYEKISTDAPLDRHFEEMQFYLNQMNLRKGKIIYVNDSSPDMQKEIDITKNATAYKDLVGNIRNARSIWSQMLDQGKGYQGNEISWVDRLRILADVSPFSGEYKHALGVVSKQKRAGLLSKRDLEKVSESEKIQKNRGRGIETYERRFKISQLTNPKTTREMTNSNEYIKAASEYGTPARIVGSIYEYLTHMNTFVNRKFVNRFSTQEIAQNQLVYGVGNSMWEHPIHDYIVPQFTMPLSGGEDLVSSITSGAGNVGMFTGLLNPELALAGAAVGGVEGLIGSAFKPKLGRTRKEEKLMGKLSQMDYFRAKQQYADTLNDVYNREAQNNMYGIITNSNDPTFGQVVKSVPYKYKNVVATILSLPVEKQMEIAAQMPGPIADVIQKFNGKSMQYKIPDMDVPSDEVLQASDEDYGNFQVKLLKKEAVNIHDYGYGFNGETGISPLSQSKLKRKLSNDFNATTYNNLYKAIQGYLSQQGIQADVIIKMTHDDSISVNIS